MRTFALIPLLFASTVVVATVVPAVAAAQTSVLPGLIDEETVEAVGTRVSPAVTAVRTREDLGPMARPRYLDGDGVAVWVQLDDAADPVWITAHAYVANAIEIEVYVDGAWQPATRVHGTSFFDLSGLEAPGPSGAEPLRLAEATDVTLALFVAVQLEPGEPAVIAPTGFGADTTEGMEYYARSMSTARNGTPIVDDQARLVAISSFTAPDRAGGTLAIRAMQIAEWYEAWDRITDDPIGWSPRVESRDMPLSTGQDALQRQ